MRHINGAGRARAGEDVTSRGGVRNQRADYSVPALSDYLHRGTTNPIALAALVMQITSSGDRNDFLLCPPVFGPERDLVDIMGLITS